MNIKDIKSSYSSLTRAIEERRLADVLELLKQLSSELHDWNTTDKINNLTYIYELLLKNVIDGIKDPQQEQIYNNLLVGCYALNDSIYEALSDIQATDFVYSQKRYLEQNGKQKADELVSELEIATANTQLPQLLESSLNTTGKCREYAEQHEIISHKVFRQLWFATTAEEAEALINKTVNNELVSTTDKCLAISALNLRLLQFFNDKMLLLLINQCTHPDILVSQRALVGLLPILAKYNSRLPLYPDIRNRLVVLFDDATVAKSIKRIILQFARTNETEKITRKVRDEIIPEIMKIAPKVDGKVDFDSLIKNENPDDPNPEWQEKIEEMGLFDKFKEISELQQEGADIHMATFAQLKQFAFFQEISNWFRPFDTRQADICELFEQEKNSFLSVIMSNNGYMCNSDKYSFCLSLLQAPQVERNMLTQSFTAESEQINEMQKEENLLQNRQAEFASNAYIQDLYRFYNIFRHRHDFENPFAYSLKFHTTWFFSLLDFDLKDITEIAEYFFMKGFYPQADLLFQKIEKETEQNAGLCQKRGFCFQQTGDIESALTYYLKADIITPNDKWTMQKIAYCYRMMGNYNDAIVYYLRVEELQPENRNIQIQIGNCYLHNKQYDEALNYYFKVEYVDEKNIKVLRAIAWTSFLGDKLTQANKYYQRIIDIHPEWSDYLNLGHTALCEGDRKKAVDFYIQAVLANNNNVNAILKSLNDDKEYLLEKRIDNTTLSLLSDYLKIYFNGEKA